MVSNQKTQLATYPSAGLSNSAPMRDHSGFEDGHTRPIGLPDGRSPFFRYGTYTGAYVAKAKNAWTQRRLRASCDFSFGQLFLSRGLALRAMRVKPLLKIRVGECRQISGPLSMPSRDVQIDFSPKASLAVQTDPSKGRLRQFCLIFNNMVLAQFSDE